MANLLKARIEETKNGYTDNFFMRFSAIFVRIKSVMRHRYANVSLVAVNEPCVVKNLQNRTLNNNISI